MNIPRHMKHYSPDEMKKIARDGSKTHHLTDTEVRDLQSAYGADALAIDMVTGDIIDQTTGQVVAPYRSPEETQSIRRQECRDWFRDLDSDCQKAILERAREHKIQVALTKAEEFSDVSDCGERYLLSHKQLAAIIAEQIILDDKQQ